VPDPRRASGFPCDVVVVGGCGRIGLPLALALADRGAGVAIYDISEPAVAAVSAGRMPFAEPGTGMLLERMIAAGRLVASADPRIVSSAEHVIVAIPASDYTWASSGPQAMARALSECAGQFRDGQILIVRSSIGPGGTAQIEKMVAERGVDMDVAFCPVRTAQGQAMTEVTEVPQIVSSRTPRGMERAGRLLRMLTPTLVPMPPEEAELAKLFANAWRYLSFAAANQLYMMAGDRGLDFERIRRCLALDYPRAASLPPAGFAAGPWLLKDMMRLAAASKSFPLGQAAVAVNEGMPEYLIGQLERRYDLHSLTVGILGMAFKAGTDDIRCSLAYRLRQLLAQRAGTLLCTDPLVSADPALTPLDEVLARADLLVIGAPHPQYRGLVPRQPVADIWNLLGRGVLA
jgi:UDP-N-acetyl-D-mannosaminuronic acid dehydrogenase